MNTSYGRNFENFFSLAHWMRTGCIVWIEDLYLSKIFFHFGFGIFHFLQAFLEADIDGVALLSHVPRGVGQNVVDQLSQLNGGHSLMFTTDNVVVCELSPGFRCWLTVNSNSILIPKIMQFCRDIINLFYFFLPLHLNLMIFSPLWSGMHDTGKMSRSLHTLK